jgi:hypothetical protein
VHRPLLALAVLLGAACAPSKTRVEYADNMDLAGYRRIAVLPFTDQKGRGRQIAEAIAKGLPQRGFEAAQSKRVEDLFYKLKPDRELGLGLNELNELRRATGAQAILSGSVDPKGDQAAVILLDIDQGDEIFKATLLPPHRGAFASSDEIAEQALGLFAELPKNAK